MRRRADAAAAISTAAGSSALARYPPYGTSQKVLNDTPGAAPPGCDVDQPTALSRPSSFRRPPSLVAVVEVCSWSGRWGARPAKDLALSVYLAGTLSAKKSAPSKQLLPRCPVTCLPGSPGSRNWLTAG